MLAVNYTNLIILIIIIYHHLSLKDKTKHIMHDLICSCIFSFSVILVSFKNSLLYMAVVYSVVSKVYGLSYFDWSNFIHLLE